SVSCWKLIVRCMVSRLRAMLSGAIAERGATPKSITVDDGSDFTGRALEAWAVQHDVQLCFIRPGRPEENGFFNGRLRDECLNRWNGSSHCRMLPISRLGGAITTTSSGRTARWPTEHQLRSQEIMR
ncbi:MAG: DDE-type integrase/transposase/recombinase, partial [Candidatus Dormibacteraceae bacterium]